MGMGSLILDRREFEGTVHHPQDEVGAMEEVMRVGFSLPQVVVESDRLGGKDEVVREKGSGFGECIA